MNTALRWIASVLISFATLALVYDVSQIRHLKKDMKDTLDISTKAAALQLDEDPIKIGMGIFEIDEEKAKQINEEIYKQNLGERFRESILSTEVINTHINTIYNAPNGKQYEIDTPTIFSVARYNYNGFFIHMDITVDILSGSVLRNKNELNNN